MPYQERIFICGLAAIGHPGAIADALPLMLGRQRVAEDFTQFVFDDGDRLPEEVHLYAYLPRHADRAGHERNRVRPGCLQLFGVTPASGRASSAARKSS